MYSYTIDKARVMATSTAVLQTALFFICCVFANTALLAETDDTLGKIYLHMRPYRNDNS